MSTRIFLPRGLFGFGHMTFMSAEESSKKTIVLKVNWSYALFTAVFVGGFMYLCHCILGMPEFTDPANYISFGIGSSIPCIIRDIWRSYHPAADVAADEGSGDAAIAIATNDDGSKPKIQSHTPEALNAKIEAVKEKIAQLKKKG